MMETLSRLVHLHHHHKDTKDTDTPTQNTDTPAQNTVIPAQKTETPSTQQHFHPSTQSDGVKKLHFGVSRVQGARQYQEDEYACVDNLSVNKGPSYFAVFDGHGGDSFAAHSSTNLHNIIFENDNFKAGNYSEAIREAMLKEDQALFEKFKGQKGGSTATVCLVTSDALYLGNVGDSRAVIGVLEDGRLVAKRLSRDHKPDDQDEERRIKEAGGVVYNGRVQSECTAINMSRAMGDFEHKMPLNHAGGDWIASEPFIAPSTNLQGVAFLVLASDGLWNFASDEEVVSTVAVLHNKGKTPDEIAKQLTHTCETNPLSDNVTVIVVFFDSDGANVEDERAGKVITSQQQSR